MSKAADRAGDSRPLSRRGLVAAAVAGGALVMHRKCFAASAWMAETVEHSPQHGTAGGRTALGICEHALPVHAEAARRRSDAPSQWDPLSLLELCHALGAGGIQAAIGFRDQQYCQRLRRRAEELGMWIEGSAGLPRDAAAVERFEAQLSAAVAAGASVVRTVLLPGRRYEQFRTLEEFREAVARAEKSLRLAEPVARKHRVLLAIENHKDLRSEELLAILNRLGSAQLKVCVDTGNNIALLEHPLETVRSLAPLAAAVHLKDMDLREYPEGFMLSEVPLGEGIVDLPQVVAILRRANRQVRFSLEMITRDPLRVPCLGPQYLATLGHLPARDLACSLKAARHRAHLPPLPCVSHLPAEDQLAAEKQNIARCIQYARGRLGL